jgi:hypothetical protein
MSERLDRAYQLLDAAVAELAAANNEALGEDDGWAVGHYFLVVGEQRFEESGGVSSAPSLFFPFNGSLTYALKGLVGEAAGLFASRAAVSEEAE